MKRKFKNYAELVQGVSQVDDPKLENTDRLFLLCLAVHSVKEDPHPGNTRLKRCCGVSSDSGLDKIRNRVLASRLAIVVERGGGRGHANVFRICEEDHRFPVPGKARTPECPVSHEKPPTNQRGFLPEKPPSQELGVSSNKPPTGGVESPLSREAPELELEYKQESARATSKQKPQSRLLERRDEMIANFGDEVYLALLFQEAQLGILLTAEQLDRVLERLMTLKACGENPVAAIPEVLRQVTGAVPTNGHGRNNKHLAGGNTGSAPVEHPELGSEAFVAFCAIYPPGKLDRKDALHSWCKGLCDDHAEEILAGVKSWKDDEQWKERRYIPFASSFLQKQRWKNAPLVEKSCTNYPELEVEA
jgi:hypothetical protein